ncbi:MAG: GTP-binding protein [Bacilli bacterium]|nr:GTP-binding protein [Bacillales bacterium]MDY2574698.1 GTP-binding protein [Bacilli bacterium]
MNKIPVFFIDGFLDSGKTTFIIDTIKSDGFDGSTLLLVCEEGEIEYDLKELKDKYHTDVEYFSGEGSFDYKVVGEMLNKYRPDRVVIEMNGMWELSSLQFPRELEILQVIYFIDASTFSTYFTNMRQKFVDIIKKSQVVVFTKCNDASKQIEPFKSALKMINSNAQYMIMNEDMKAFDAFEEPLPYDVTKEVITIEDRDFATFYIDTFDHKDRYNDKIVEYDGQVFFSKKLPKNTFILGRKIMNCCAQDIQLCGFLVKSCLGKKLKDRTYIHIKAKLVYEFSSDYNEEEVMLEPIEIKEIEPLKEEVLNLVG